MIGIFRAELIICILYSYIYFIVLYDTISLKWYHYLSLLSLFINATKKLQNTIILYINTLLSKTKEITLFCQKAHNYPKNTFFTKILVLELRKGICLYFSKQITPQQTIYLTPCSYLNSLNEPKTRIMFYSVKETLYYPNRIKYCLKYV